MRETKQPDLFDAYARRSDPETSHKAAKSVEPALPYLEECALKAVRAAGCAGRNLDELIQSTGMDKVTISPRLRPLCDKGFVIEHGKRPGKAGRQQIVWVATEFAAHARND